MLHCLKATTFVSEINKQRIISNNYNNNLKTKKIMKKIQFMSLMAHNNGTNRLKVGNFI